MMLYLDRGINLIGSDDGIHWQSSSHARIFPRNMDCPNVVFDPEAKTFAMYCSPKHIYSGGGAPGDRIDKGDARRIARGLEVATAKIPGIARPECRRFVDQHVEPLAVQERRRHSIKSQRGRGLLL